MVKKSSKQKSSSSKKNSLFIFSKSMRLLPALLVLILAGLFVHSAIGDLTITFTPATAGQYNLSVNGTNLSGTVVLNLSVTESGDDARLGAYNLTNVTWNWIPMNNATALLKKVINSSANVTGAYVAAADGSCMNQSAMNCSNYSVSFVTSTLPDGIYNVTINATYNDTNNAAEEYHNKNLSNITIDNTAPRIVSFALNLSGSRDNDQFVNNNSILNITVLVLDNVTGTTYEPNGSGIGPSVFPVLVNITSRGAAATSSGRIVNVTNLSGIDAVPPNATQGYQRFFGVVNLSAFAVDFNFTQLTVNISYGPNGVRGLYDRAHNAYDLSSPSNSTTFFAYNLSHPKNSTCLFFNTTPFNYGSFPVQTKNLSTNPPTDRSLNFSRVAYELAIFQNKSACNFNASGPIDANAGYWERVAFVNFSNLSINATLGRQLESNVRRGVNITIGNRSLSSDFATISINTSHVALNYSANVTLFGIRTYGSTTPGVIPSGPSPSKHNQTYGTNFSYAPNIGNFTFVVTGFSQFNITDNTTPIITFSDPVNNSNLTLNTTRFNISINGTGTPILNSSLNITILPDDKSVNYTNMTCAAQVLPNTGSDTMICSVNMPTLNSGAKTANISVRDTGLLGVGNERNLTVNFHVMPNTPTISVIGSSSKANSSNDTVMFFNTTEINITLVAGNTTDQYLNFTPFLNGTQINSSGNISVNQSFIVNLSSNNSQGNGGIVGENNYTIVIQVNNSANVTGNSSATTSITAYVDIDAPYNITWLAPASGVSTLNQSVVFNFNVTDNLAPAVRCNVTRTDGTLITYDLTAHTRRGYVTNFTDGNVPVGTTNYQLLCYDNASNKNTSQVLSISRNAAPSQISGSQTSGGGGGGGRRVTGTSKSFSASPQGTDQMLSSGDRGMMSVHGNTYSATVTAITMNKANVVLNNIAKTLDVGQMLAYDLNNDGTNDVEVTLTKTLFNRAFLNFKEIPVRVQAAPPSETTESTEEATQEAVEESAQGVEVGAGEEGQGAEATKVAKKRGPLIPILVVLVVIFVALFFRYQRKVKARRPGPPSKPMNPLK